MLGRGFHTFIKNVSFSSPTDMGSHNPPLPRSGPSILADTRSSLQSMWNLTIHPPRGLSILSFLSPIDVESHNPPPSFGTQRPRWHSFLSPIDVESHNSPPLRGPASSLAHRLVSGSNIICNSPSPLLVRGFHTLIKNISFSSPTDMGSHN